MARVMKASDLFVACLVEEGVEYVFGVPGEENLDLLESLRTSPIQLVVTRHEQHAAFMAAAYGRLTGRAGVCLATLGPGATNLLTGVAHAQMCGVPLLAITGQKPVHQNWQANFQLVDVVGAFRPMTKWNRSILSASTIPRFLRHAFKVAEDERPGACHLELPEDVARESVDGRPFPRVRLRRPVPDDKAVEQARRLLRGAKTPVMLLSAGANRKRVTGQVAQFVEKTGISAVCTQMGKGVLPDDHPRSLGCLGIHKRDWVHAVMRSADLVITVGYDIAEYPPFVWNETLDKKILHIDFSMAEPDQYYSPDVELIGDVGNSLWRLHSGFDPSDRFDTACMDALRDALGKRLALPEASSFPILPSEVVAQARRALDRRDVIALDNGIYKLWFARMYPTYADNTVLLDNAFATMGAGLGMAMATKLVHPGRRVLAVVGDGGFMMNSQDLETAVRLSQNVVVLILRDDAYGFIRWKQRVDGLPDFGMEFSNPDFVRYAEAYGARGLRYDGSRPLSEVLEDAFRSEGPVLVDCPVDYSENAKLEEDLSLELGHLMEASR